MPLSSHIEILNIQKSVSIIYQTMLDSIAGHTHKLKPFNQTSCLVIRFNVNFSKYI